MEKPSSRYRDNNERIRRMKSERRRRESRKRGFMAAIIGVAAVVIVFLGVLIFTNVFSGGKQKPAEEAKGGGEAAQETEYTTESKHDTAASKIDQTSLEEIIASAQKKAETADAEENAEGLAQLKQRIQEAKDLISENAPEEKLGVAYLNLILAINDLAEIDETE